MTHEEVVSKVKRILQEALEPEVSVEEGDELGDLKIEPVDLLDINFRLQRVFGVNPVCAHEAEKLKRRPEIAQHLQVSDIVHRIERLLAQRAVA